MAARCGYERVPKVTEAKAIGLELRDTTVVILGSPQAGTPVMVAAALVALDLPCKVLVWADGCETKVSYTAPGAYAKRHDLREDLANRLAGIHAVTDAVIDKQKHRSSRSGAFRMRDHRSPAQEAVRY